MTPTVASKLFPERGYADLEKALPAARRWRDEVLARLPPMTSRELRTLVRRNNRSGIPGVSRMIDRASGAVYWVAKTESDGKRRARKFSVRSHGEEGARQHAIAAREQFLHAAESRFCVLTNAGQALSRAMFGDSASFCADDSVVWDASARTRFFERLAADGLIDREPVPAVRRYHFPSWRGPIWQATLKGADCRMRMRRFSVAKYGEAEAERLAWDALRTAQTR